MPWSLNRILYNFFIYRKFIRPFPPGEKKRIKKKNERSSKPEDPDVSNKKLNADNRESKRALIGFLINSYDFKKGGLIKKTISINIHGVYYHFVSYYKISDILDGSLTPFLKDPRFNNIEPRTNLIARQNFRVFFDDAYDGI